ncbi:MAG: hypothetical protein U5R06_17800 [candidate division KSB1 bacterium]|nr:hypothetical protein [candidate division KSB1 bacterium]
MTTRSKPNDVHLSPQSKDDPCERSALFHQLMQHQLEQPVADRVFDWAEDICREPVIWFQCRSLGRPHNGDMEFRLAKTGKTASLNSKDDLWIRAVQDTKQDRLVLYARPQQHQGLHRYTLILPGLTVQAPIRMAGKCVLPSIALEQLDGQKLVLRFREDALTSSFQERFKRMLCS